MKTICDGCGKDMHDPVKNRIVIGLYVGPEAISHGGSNTTTWIGHQFIMDTSDEFLRQQAGRFADKELVYCWECYLETVLPAVAAIVKA